MLEYLFLEMFTLYHVAFDKWDVINFSCILIEINMILYVLIF